MEITEVVKPFIRRGWLNTFDNIVYIYVYIFYFYLKNDLPFKNSEHHFAQIVLKY